MWYFAWMLGLGLAAALGILNALWFELRPTREAPPSASSRSPRRDPVRAPGRGLPQRRERRRHGRCRSQPDPAAGTSCASTIRLSALDFHRLPHLVEDLIDTEARCPLAGGHLRNVSGNRATSACAGTRTYTFDVSQSS